jgi:hypothetical protein
MMPSINKSEIKPKLVWSGDNWITTFVSLRDAAEDRRLEVRLPDGRTLGIEFGLCGGSKSFLAVTVNVGRKKSPVPLKSKAAKAVHK